MEKTGSDPILSKHKRKTFSINSDSENSCSSDRDISESPKKVKKFHFGDDAKASSLRKKNRNTEKAPSRNRVINALSVEDLPPSDRKMIKDCGFDDSFLEENFILLLKCLHFVTKGNYWHGDEAVVFPSETSSYGSDEMKEEVLAEIISLDVKKAKKRFKKFVKIGKGGFGTVFHCKTSQYDTPHVAVKKLSHVKSSDIDNNLTEIGFLRMCNHVNIVRYFDAYLVKNELWMVTEHVAGITLDHANGIHKFEKTQLAYITTGILEGLAYLHKKHIAHRDIKGANIILGNDGIIKIIDFGLAADMSEGERTQSLGTYWTISPEIINRNPHGVKTDVWSLGMVLLELQMKNKISIQLQSLMVTASGKISHYFPSGMDRYVKNFMSKCLQVDPEERYSVKRLLKHKFLTEAQSQEDFSELINRICVVRSMTLA